MASLEDLRTGKIKVSGMTSVVYDGQVYRGKELKDLLKRHEGDLSTEEIQGDAVPDPNSKTSKSSK